MSGRVDIPADTMSKMRRKRAARRTRENQGFEEFPPRCLNCNHYREPNEGRPEAHGLKGLRHLDARCKLGGFKVRASSICDKWIGRDGATLADEPGNL